MKSYFKKKELRDWFNNELEDALVESERDEILVRLLERQGISRLDWAVAQEVEIDHELWKSYIFDLKKDKPVQYILGYEYFGGYKFMVTPQVLIPRPETEELVNWVVSEFGEYKKLKILEIGTGSGCIAISLGKKLHQANIIASDISADALQVAKQNAKEIGAEVQFVKDDILKTKLEILDFDIIVSNPPYIPLDEIDSIQTRVKDYEPSVALFTEKSKPLQFYETIMLQSKKSLEYGGTLFFELHENYAQEVFLQAEKMGLYAEIRNDFYGKARMIKIKCTNFRET